MRIENQLQPVLLPQLHLTPVGELLEVGLAGGEHPAIEEFLAVVDAKVADDSLVSVHIKVGPPDKCLKARLVGYRADALYLRATSEELGKGLLKTLSLKWKQLRQLQIDSPLGPTQHIQTPSVQITMSMCFDDNYRAVAKIAFNLLAANKGADFVLRGEFDPIRDYIRGIGLVHLDPLPDGVVAVDTRYVHQVARDEGPPLPTGSHAVLIMNAPPFLGALVTLYEKTSFIVRLAEAGLMEEVLVAHEFSIDGSANAALGTAELVKRLIASRVATRSPSAR